MRHFALKTVSFSVFVGLTLSAHASGMKVPVTDRVGTYQSYKNQVNALQKTYAGMVLNFNQLKKNQEITAATVASQKEKLDALKAQADQIQSGITSTSEKLKADLSLNKVSSSALTNDIADRLAARKDLQGADAAEARAALAKSLQPTVQGVLDQLQGAQLLSDYSDLKWAAKDVEQNLSILEMRYDETLLGAYVRQKMRSTLSSQEFCQAAVEAARGGADSCKNGDFKKAAMKRSTSEGASDGSWDESLLKQMNAVHKVLPPTAVPPVTASPSP